ncbi:MAG: hypothetical protein ACK50J_30140, partial [Planctomyces sp.]
NNVNLSEIFWALPGMGGIPKGSSVLAILLRESPGIIATLVYFAVLPPILGLTILRTYFIRMGVIRFLVFSNLLLWMAVLPVKMLLRWAFSLKYIVGIPEYFFNI